MRFEQTLTLRPPTLVQRLWYWRICLPAPQAVTSRSVVEDWVRLLPQSWTRIHRRHADKHSLFWLPCTLCSRHYGGHQFAGSIPDPTSPPGHGVGICPACTRAGRSWRVPHPLEAVLDGLRDKYEHGHGEEPMIRDCTQCVAWDTAIRDAFANTPEPPASA